MEGDFQIPRNQSLQKHKRSRSSQSQQSDTAPPPVSSKKAKTTNPPPTPPSKTTKTFIPPLFTEISKDANSAKVFLELKKHIRYSRKTQAGNLLIYPRSAEDRTSLLNLTIDGCTVRDTKKTNQKSADDNLTIVIIGVPPKYNTDEFSSFSGFTDCTRMLSAALGRPTNRIKATCSTTEEKQNLIKHCFSFDFRKLQVEEYNSRRPLQCIKCQSFGHRADTCSNETRCKRRGLGHGHKECPSPPEKASCTNCKGEHPSSYSGCPSYKEAILSIKQKETTTAQKIAPPANILDATRIAATLAQVLTEILLTPHQEVTQDMILLKIAKSVSVMFKVNMTPSLISSIY